MKIRSMLVLYSATQYDKKALKLIIYLALTMLIAFADTFGIATLIPLVEGILRKDGSVQFLSYHFAVDTRLLIFFVLVWLLRGVVISIANYIVAHMIQNYKTALQISYVTNLFERDGREENKLTGEAFTRLTNDVQIRLMEEQQRVRQLGYEVEEANRAVFQEQHEVRQQAALHHADEKSQESRPTVIS